MNVLQCMFHYARTANAHIYDGIGFAYAMESASHKRVVVGRIAKHNQLGTTNRVALLGAFGSFLDNVAHEAYGIHIDTCFCAAYVHRAAN